MYNPIFRSLLLVLCVVVINACQNETEKQIDIKHEVAEKEKTVNSKKILNLLSIEESGIDFENTLVETNDRNFFTDNYIYNGGGVAIGDINHDNLSDIVFTSNQGECKVYVNKGGLKFEDFTEQSNIKIDGWKTGVTMADVNGDGHLDVYICRANGQETNLDRRRNKLFINDGQGSFSEQSKKFGLDHPGYSIQASFFDFDNDGDLDMYLTNHPTDYKLNIADGLKLKKENDPYSSDRFFINSGNGFEDVTGKMRFNHRGHGLGIATGDLNNDGYTDMYIANDYLMEDILFMNQGGQSFKQELQNKIKYTSLFSMGVDINDINNDGLMDIGVNDMNPADNYRSKATMPSMNADLFWNTWNAGFGAQYMRNTIQLNSESSFFSEIGQLSGVSNTDWSWSLLFVDLNNDMNKDIIITNGYLRDVDEKDVNKKLKKLQKKNGGSLKWSEITPYLRSVKLRNYVFENKGDLTFENQQNDWGFNQPTFSNGMAYGDLDNDGDMEIVINNLNERAFLYENKSDNNYLKVKLSGNKNKFGIGAKVNLFIGEKQLSNEVFGTRGYLSSVEPVIHFGLGSTDEVDRLEVIWPGGKRQTINNVKANQTLTLKEQDAKSNFNYRPEKEAPIFSALTGYCEFDFAHTENEFDDYHSQVLLPHKMSQFGPAVAYADVTGDGLEDVYIGGAKDQPSALYVQNKDNKFKRFSPMVWENHAQHEDVDATFFDADGDGDLDLYVVSGGFEWKPNHEHYQDRLYVNNGKTFVDGSNRLPKVTSSGGKVIAWDYDRDGDADLIVLGKVIPNKYPYPPDTYVLENKDGKFEEVSIDIAPTLHKVGMVHTAELTDFGGDGHQELVVAGDWTSVKVFHFNGSKIVEKDMGLPDDRGWWSALAIEDIDGDGDKDIVAGNLGSNYKYKASKKENFSIYCDDFDENGSYDIVLGYYNKGVQYPVRGLQCSSDQMPFVKEEFPEYNSFASASVKEVYGNKLADALHLYADEFRSVIYRNNGTSFTKEILPMEAQLSTINGLIVDDFNKDGRNDILVAGNLFVSEVETGMASASNGLLLEGNKDGSFSPVGFDQTGFLAPGDVKHIHLLNSQTVAPLVFIANNNKVPQIYGFRR